jgi:2-polyprenyl-3-methyl-5-hydroxy-6-metoxy-1,4-benzoquinol methylase
MKKKNTLREDTSARHSKKYQNKHLIHKLFLGRFLDRCAEAIKPFAEKKALDFGCGEAFFWQEMSERGVDMQHLTGIDLRDDALDLARQTFPQHSFLKQDLLTIEPAQHQYDLIIASQVLEHLPSPELFLKKLVKCCNPDGLLLLTVPWEPFFMLSNLARGRDILRLGNHPEHINLWGAKGFKKFVAAEANINQNNTVFPFQMITAKP